MSAMPSPVDIPELRLDRVQAWKTDIIRIFNQLSERLSDSDLENPIEIEHLFQRLKDIYEIANHHRCSPMNAEIKEVLEARSIIGFIHNTKNKMVKAYDFFSASRTSEAQILVSSLQYEELIFDEKNQTLEFMILHFERLQKAFPDHTIRITIDEAAKGIRGFREGLVAIHSTLENLLMNAIEYAGEAGAIELFIEKINESCLEIGVRDQSTEELPEDILSKINASEETMEEKSMSPPRSTIKGSPTSWGMGLSQSFAELRLLFDPTRIELSQSSFNETSGTKTLSFKLPIHDDHLSLNPPRVASSHYVTPARRLSDKSHPETNMRYKLGIALAFMTAPPPDVFKPEPTSPFMKGVDTSLKTTQTHYAFVLVEDCQVNIKSIERAFTRTHKTSDWNFFAYTSYDSCIEFLQGPTFQESYRECIIAIDSSVEGSLSGTDFLRWTLTPEAAFLKGKSQLVWYSDRIVDPEDLFKRTECHVSDSKLDALSMQKMKALIDKSETRGHRALETWTLLSHP